MLSMTANAALLTHEQFKIKVNYGYLDDNSNFVVVESKYVVSNCTHSTGHSGYVHGMNPTDILAKAGYSGMSYRVTRYGYWDSPASTTNCNYNITGSAPYKADQTIWVFGADEPTIETPKPGDLPGSSSQPGASGSGDYWLQVVFVNTNKTSWTYGPSPVTPPTR